MGIVVYIYIYIFLIINAGFISLSVVASSRNLTNLNVLGQDNNGIEFRGLGFRV